MIFVDDSLVKVGGLLLPGIVKSLEISDSAHIDEQEVEGSTRRVKQADGYEDAKVTIELILDDSPDVTRMQKLESVQRLFRTAGQAKPTVYELINEHTVARKMSKVIFKTLSTKQDSKKNQLTAMLEFCSYDPTTITTVKSGSKTSATQAINLDPTYQTYLTSDRGSAPQSPGLQPKTSSSPSKDTATVKRGTLDRLENTKF